MNKNLLLLVFIFSLLSIQAQKNNDDIFGEENDTSTTTNNFIDDYKPHVGNHSLEISFNPSNIFSGKGGDAFSLTNGGIKYRNFKADNKAFRIGTDLTFYNSSEITQEEDTETSDLELRSKISHYHINIMPGFEKHYNVSKKLSPYTGMQFLLGYGHNSSVAEYQDDNRVESITITNIADEYFGTASLNVGAGVLAGFDYYIAKKLYMGVEIGFGVEFAKALKSTYTDSANPSDEIELVHGSSIAIAPNMTNTNIRLGWIF